MSDRLKFKYKPKPVKSFLYNGIGFMIIGIISLINPSWLSPYVFIGYGFISFINYYYLKNTAYVIIDHEGLKLNRYISKRIAWADFEGIRFYVSHLTVLSKDKTIDINKRISVCKRPANHRKTIESQITAKKGELDGL